MLGHSFSVNIGSRVVATPTARTAFNQFDEFGLLLGTLRLLGEKNADYKDRLLDTFAHRANASYLGLVYAITRELGLELFQPISIQPKTSMATGEFFAPDPLILFDGVYLYLYSDYANETLDQKIDRYEPGGNYEHLGRLVDVINQTTYFQAQLLDPDYQFTRSMTILNQSGRTLVNTEAIQVSTKFRLAHKRLVSGTLVYSDLETFNKEVTSEAAVTAHGKYYINYKDGIVRTYDSPASGSWITYQYTEHPFKPIASPIILNDISSESFRVKMFEQILGDDGSYSHGGLTELGTDIINEILSTYPGLFGE